MKENRFFNYVDNVELSQSMKNNLIRGDVPFREARPMHRRGFALLGGMAAVLCGAVISGYVFLMNGGLMPPALENDIHSNHNPATHDSMIMAGGVAEQSFMQEMSDTDAEITEARGYASVDFSHITPASPIHPSTPRSFWYSDLRGEEYITDIYSSLKYHTEFDNFSQRYTLSAEEFNENINTLEQFVFDFLNYVAMPLILIPEPVPIRGDDITPKEELRQLEIESTIIALSIARAFYEGNIGKLESRFSANTPGLFDFAKGMGFREFTMLGTEFDPVTYEHLHYFSIIEDNREDNVFTGEHSWIMRTDGYQVKLFAPADREIDRVQKTWWLYEHDELVNFCYFYSTLYLLQPEESYPRNLRGLFSFTHLGHNYTNFNEYGGGYFEVDEFIELVDYVYGIEIDLEMILEARMFWESEDGEIYVTLHAGGYIPTRAELSSDIERDGRRIIIMNFYGDAGYMFLAETLMFELESGDKGWQLTSVGTIGDNPDVNVAFIHY